MALASFFDKAALSAAAILKNFDRDAFARTLDKHVIGLAIDDDAAHSPEAMLSAALAVDLLARLYPRMAIATVGTAAGEEVARLVARARAINPAIEIHHGLDRVTHALALGTSRMPLDGPVVYVGSSGWLSEISPHGPVGVGATLNPFGPGGAACLGAAALFRTLFREQIIDAEPDAPVTLSMLDFRVADAAAENPDLRPVDLGRLHLVGVGAIGTAAVWALSQTPGLRGLVYLIDPELVELTNLQRYILTRQGDENSAKVALAAAALQGTAIRACPLRYTWGEYLHVRGAWDFDTVAVAVDSAADRIAVQASLPRRIVNAWTQPWVLGVSQHDFLGDRACLACLYLPMEAHKNDDERIAEEVGLPGEKQLIRRLLHTGRPAGRPLLERIAGALKIPLEPLLRFESQPLGVFYRDAICAGLVLRLGADLRGGLVEVPMAFQSALAGIMLAAELVAVAGSLRTSPLPVTTRLDLSRGPRVWTTNEKKGRTGRCLCDDADYMAVYQRKYGSTE